MTEAGRENNPAASAQDFRELRVRKNEFHFLYFVFSFTKFAKLFPILAEFERLESLGQDFREDFLL